MKVTIFYSWQSDTRAAANRTLIQDALEAAAAEIRADGSIAVEPVLDRDTQAVPGAPDIGSTIFEKIDASAAMVADVTIVNRGTGHRPAPNPNVLIEVGYALKALGQRRLILVQNVAFGGPEDLPFDLRQKRVLTYNSPEDALGRAPERRQLQSALMEALSLVLTDAVPQRPPPYPAKLSMEYVKKTIRSERHDYELQITLTNDSTKPFTEWHVDVTIPTRLLEPPNSFAIRIPERSNEVETLLRATHLHGRPIYPGDPRVVMSVGYRVDSEIFWKQQGLFDRKVTAKAYVHGELVATAERVVRELQHFDAFLLQSGSSDSADGLLIFYAT